MEGSALLEFAFDVEDDPGLRVPNPLFNQFFSSSTFPIRRHALYDMCE